MTAIAKGRVRPPTLHEWAPVVVVSLVVAAFGWAMEHASYDVWGGILVGVAVVLVNASLVRAATRREDPRLARLIALALYLKLAAAVVRYGVAFGLYDGSIDAASYHDTGALLAPAFRAGDFTADIGPVVGTGFIEILTGVVYVFTGPTTVGGFLVFSALGFWGLYFFYRAFRLAVPEGDPFRYACLVLLLPSLLFWPSSIGKEAWMTLTLGLAALGAARILTRHRGGFVVTIAGLGGMAMVRPHVSMLVLIGLFGAYVLRRAPSGRSLAGPFGKLAGIVVLGVAVAVLLGSVRDFLGLDEFDEESVQLVLQETSARTSEAGSTFRSSTDLNPSRFPSALTSVLFRPFPWEARNAQAFIAAAEGLVLVGLFVAGRWRIVSAFRQMLRTPYVTFCVIYSVLFVYAFSGFSNFGILTRQRVQVFPFVLVLLAVPALRVDRRSWRRIFVEETTPAEPASQTVSYDGTTTLLHESRVVTARNSPGVS